MDILRKSGLLIDTSDDESLKMASPKFTGNRESIINLDMNQQIQTVPENNLVIDKKESSGFMAGSKRIMQQKDNETRKLH